MKKESDNIIVSICCLAYNHEEYIEQAIEGFLMQDTNFQIEILIHDDASTDRTRKIIEKYHAEYPNLIKPIYQEENQYSKGIKPIFKYLFPRAKGKYIALCEGDDYWIDSLKLQKQVDFLEENNSIVLCFHPVDLEISKSIQETHGLIEVEERFYNAKEILSSWVIPTVSVVFRNVNIPIISKRMLKSNYIYGDIILFLSLLEYGEIYCINTKMAIYRRHMYGVTQEEKSLEFYEKIYKHREEIANDFGGKYKYLKKQELSYSYFSLSLNYIKKLKLKGVKYFIKSIFFNPNVLIDYLRKR